MKKSQLAKAGLLVLAVLQTGIGAYAKEEPRPEEEPMFLEINLSEPDPLEQIKHLVIEKKAAEGLLDPATVNMKESRMSISRIDRDNPLQPVTVMIHLSNGEDDSIAYQLQTQAYLSFREADKPRILLTAEEAELEIGDEFDPMSYIAFVSAEEETFPTISVIGSVNTEEEGFYEIWYAVTAKDGSRGYATLFVTVKKPQKGIRTVSMEEAHINDDGSIEAMFAAINAVREANGLHPYKWGEEAALTAAAIRAEEASYYVSHTRPDGSLYYTAMDECGVQYANFPHEILVAYGDSVEVNLNWWLNEPGHAAIVLSDRLQTIAIGKYGAMWSAEVY